jgi:hypothetical protein
MSLSVSQVLDSRNRDSNWQGPHQNVLPGLLEVAILQVCPGGMACVMDVPGRLPHSAVALEARAKADLCNRSSVSHCPVK